MLRTVSESLHGLIHAAAQAIPAHLLIRTMTRHFQGKLCLGTTPHGERELASLDRATLCSSHRRHLRLRLTVELRHCFACQPSCRSMFLCLRHPHASMGTAGEWVMGMGGWWDGGMEGGREAGRFTLSSSKRAATLDLVNLA